MNSIESTISSSLNIIIINKKLLLKDQMKFGGKVIG
jgi:hypothetical protein